MLEKRMLTNILEPNKEEVSLCDELRVLNIEDFLVSSVVIALSGY